MAICPYVLEINETPPAGAGGILNLW